MEATAALRAEFSRELANVTQQLRQNQEQMRSIGLALEDAAESHQHAMQGVTESQRRATDEAVRGSRDYTTETIAAVRAEFAHELADVSREFTEHRKRIASLQRSAEQEEKRMDAKVDVQNLNEIEQRLAETEAGLRNIYQSRIWRTLVRLGGLVH